MGLSIGKELLITSDRNVVRCHCKHIACYLNDIHFRFIVFALSSMFLLQFVSLMKQVKFGSSCDNNLPSSHLLTCGKYILFFRLFECD